jgi:hypothetical protein
MKVDPAALHLLLRRVRATFLSEADNGCHEPPVVLNALMSPTLGSLLLVLFLDLRCLAPDLASSGKGSVDLTHDGRCVERERLRNREEEAIKLSETSMRPFCLFVQTIL